MDKMHYYSIESKLEGPVRDQNLVHCVTGQLGALDTMPKFPL